MVNPELVKQLLKELEAEKGCPVQLKVDTPESVGHGLIGEGEYFGKFEERGTVVRRVDNLDEQSKKDVELIEGEYTNLIELQRKIKEYNILYSSIGVRLSLIAEHKQVAFKDIFEDFKERKINADREELEKILREKGTKYFKHNIEARPDGVYDDRTSGGECPVDETKIADITLKLVE